MLIDEPTMALLFGANTARRTGNDGGRRRGSQGRSCSHPRRRASRRRNCASWDSR